MKINVLTDYRGWLFSSVRVLKEKHILTMDIELLKKYANEEGVELVFMKYTDVDFRKDYSGQFFIYTSSEDPGLFYKGFLEDISCALKHAGAVLIPEWRYMRAHHNKVLMEILRDIDLAEVDTGIHSSFWGCNEEFFQKIDEIDFPCVFKSSEGAGSLGVALLRDKNEARVLLEKNNRNRKTSAKDIILGILGKREAPVHSNYRKKFVIQNFVPGLSGDYKVLIYGDKYYALSRKNRDNDFRASGGGKLDYEPFLPEGIFDFAKKVYDALNVPVVSLDIAFDGNRFYLIEFQCCHFGTATIEYSTHYYYLNNNEWTRYDGSSIMEKEFISSIKRHIIKNHFC